MCISLVFRVFNSQVLYSWAFLWFGI
jgi:hypothetical protein